MRLHAGSGLFGGSPPRPSLPARGSLRRVAPVFRILGSMLLALAAAGLVLASLLLATSLAPRIAHLESQPLAAMHRLEVRFWLPPVPQAVESRLRVLSELPAGPVRLETRWLDARRLAVTLWQEGTTRGQRLRLALEELGPTLSLAGVNLAAGWPRRTVRSRPFAAAVPPQLVERLPPDPVPSRGPIRLRFNTPLDAHSVAAAAALPAPGVLRPAQQISPEGISYEDATEWIYTPTDPLPQGQELEIRFSPSLKGRGGGVPDGPLLVRFTVDSPPRLVRIEPSDGAPAVLPYTPVRIRVDRPLASASLQVQGMAGRTLLEEDRQGARFLPVGPYRSGARYRVTAWVRGASGEDAPPVEWGFEAADLRGRLWVDLRVGEEAEITVRDGDLPVRRVEVLGVSGDGLASPAFAFASHRVTGRGFRLALPGQPALYWLLTDGPVRLLSAAGGDGMTGCGADPALLCLQVPAEDAMWMAENLAEGTWVIVHP